MAFYKSFEPLVRDDGLIAFLWLRLEALRSLQIAEYLGTSLWSN